MFGRWQAPAAQECSNWTDVINEPTFHFPAGRAGSAVKVVFLLLKKMFNSATVGFLVKYWTPNCLNFRFGLERSPQLFDEVQADSIWVWKSNRASSMGPSSFNKFCCNQPSSMKSDGIHWSPMEFSSFRYLQFNQHHRWEIWLPVLKICFYNGRTIETRLKFATAWHV